MRISDWSSDVCSSDLRLVAWFGDAADWQIESVADGYHFSRAGRGVTDHYVVDLPFLASAEARKLHGLAAEEAASYAKPSRLVTVKQAAAREDEDGEGQPPQQSAGRTIRLPSELLEAIFEAGRKGLSIQRYKG